MLRTNTHNILISYLKKRNFRVKSNEYVTTDYDIMAGVPQRSVLGRTLYLIFTADLPTSDRVLTFTFVDDTAILNSHCNSVIATSELNCHLKCLDIWYNNCRIRINEPKSKHVTFTLRKGGSPPVFLNNIELPHESKTVYLRIHLDRRLSWRSHIEKSSDHTLNIGTYLVNWKPLKIKLRQ